MTAAAGRTTVFEDESYIGTKEDPDLQEMDLLMVLETSLDVQGRLNL